MSRRRKLQVVYALAVLASLVAFTPLVIPAGVIEPRVLGMPRTLWAGILVTIALVFLTYLAGRYAPSDAEHSNDAPRTDRSSRPA